MKAKVNIQNINIQQEMVATISVNIHILLNMFTITKILTDVTEYINIFEYTTTY